MTKTKKNLTNKANKALKRVNELLLKGINEDLDKLKSLELNFPSTQIIEAIQVLEKRKKAINSVLFAEKLIKNMSKELKKLHK